MVNAEVKRRVNKSPGARRGRVAGRKRPYRMEPTIGSLEERYGGMMERMLEGCQIIGFDWRYLYANSAACWHWRREREELLGRTVMEVYPGIDGKELFARLQRCLEERIAQDTKGEFTFPDGDRGWLELSIQPVPEGIMVLSLDVTQHKCAQDLVRQSEERYRLLAENISDVIWTTDVNDPNQPTYISPSVTCLLGYSAEEAISKPMAELFAPLTYENAMETLREKKSTECNGWGEPFGSKTLELWMRRKDGSLVPVEVRYSLVRGNDRQPTTVLAVAREITQSKKMEEQIKRAAEEWRTTFDSITDLITILDKDCRILRVNKAFASLFGKAPKELIGKYCYEVVHKKGAPIDSCPHLKTMQARKPATVEFYEPSLDVILEETTSPIFDDKGEIVASVRVARDITARKRMEEQLLLTDRLASIGELASGIAHELNNPLTSVIGFSQLLMEKDIPDDMKDDLTMVNTEAQRAAGIVKKLLTFARKHPPVKQLTRLNETIEEVLKLRAYEQKVNNIKVDRRFTSELPEIMADCFQMQQVFLNLIINAEYFMTKVNQGGTLTIATERRNGVARLSFGDDGPGIRKEDLGRLFTPFFTTKEVGKGTGLGLSICHGIVAEHGGRIYARSQPGKGATFVVELPINGS